MTHSFTALLLLAAGCSGSTEEDLTNDGAHCELQDSTTLTDDEATELGSTVAELRTWIDGEHTSIMNWADDTESPISITVTSSGSAVWETYARAESEGQSTNLMDVICNNRLVLPATLVVSTEDGRLDESWTGSLTLTATQPAEQSPSADFFTELDTLSGTLDPESFVPASEDYDTFESHFSASLFADGSMSGALTGGIEGSTGSGPEDAVFSGVVPIGSFGTAADER